MIKSTTSILSGALLISGLVACDKEERNETINEAPAAAVTAAPPGAAAPGTTPVGAQPASEEDKKAAYDEWDINKVATAIEAKSATPVDANSESTRKDGVVPGAVLLTSSSRYETAELPDDKASHLVFYCGSTSCTASDTAAERALENGYTNVHVMREGIAGWKEAGKPVTKPNS